MRINGEIQCPGCGLTTKILNVKAPQKIEPTLVVAKCEGCESELMAKLTVAKGQSDRTKLNIRVMVRRPSQALVDMLKEDAEFRAKSVEEQSAEADAKV